MRDLPHGLKIATVWALVTLVVFLGIRAWERESARSRVTAGEGTVEIRRSPDGHFHWPGTIRGRRLDFLVDTGATTSAIDEDLARELDLPVVGRIEVRTAGGSAQARVVIADLRLEGGVSVTALRLAALPHLDGGPLLGMDVLGRLRWSQDGGVLRLHAR